jgi:hypothetical protein
MMPSHLQVFDGLRITTEHVEHLQAALDTSVHDLRAIAGLNRVYEGFEVTAAADGELSVGPGLAFDARAERIVSGDAQTVTLAPDAAGEHFVCVAYEQVRTGEVEGVPTLVFDGAAASVRPAPPEPAEGIAVARVTRGADGALRIDDLRAREPQPAVPAAALARDQGVARIEPAAAVRLGPWLRGAERPEIELGRAALAPAVEVAHLGVSAVVTLTARWGAEALEIQVTCQGDALLGDAIRQQGLTTGPRRACVSAQAVGCVEAGRMLEERSLALAPLVVELQVVRDEGGHPAVSCALQCTEPPDETAAAAADDAGLELVCEATIAWTAASN